MKKGKLIVLEGGDGSGKTVQAKLLHERLSGRAQVFEFPRYYTSRAGKLVGECLAGEHGDFLKLGPYLASLPYTIDRAGAKKMLGKALEKGNVICNRYTPSNLAHQGAKISDMRARGAFIDFLEALEYEELELPRPDIVIYLYVPVAIAAKLGENKEKRAYLKNSGEIRDQHERDLAYQENVAKAYMGIAKDRDDWHIVRCVEDGDVLLSPRVIHELVWKIVSPRLSSGA